MHFKVESLSVMCLFNIVNSVLLIKIKCKMSWQYRKWDLARYWPETEVWSNPANGSRPYMILNCGHDISDWSVPCARRYNAEHEHSMCHFLQEQDNKGTILWAAISSAPAVRLWDHLDWPYHECNDQVKCHNKAVDFIFY